MSFRFFEPRPQFCDANGVPLNGGSVTFYETGTSTPLDTYSDADLTTANTNPVTLGSDGRPESSGGAAISIFLQRRKYKAVIKDSSGVTVYTVDPYDGYTVDPYSGAGVISKTGDYTIKVGDFGKLVAVDASSAAVTLTLPATADAGDGFQIAVKKTDSSSNTVTIDGDGSETIDGSATLVLDSQYQSVALRCDGTEWHVIALGRDVPLGTAAGKDIGGVNGLSCELLAEGDFSSAQSSIDFTGLTSDHFKYELVLDRIQPVVDGDTLAFRSGVGSFDSGTSDYEHILTRNINGTGANGGGGNANQSEGTVAGWAGQGNGNSEGMSAIIEFTGVSDATSQTGAIGHSRFRDASGNASQAWCSALRVALQADDRLQVFYQSGDIARAKYKLYGWRA